MARLSCEGHLAVGTLVSEKRSVTLLKGAGAGECQKEQMPKRLHTIKNGGAAIAGAAIHVVLDQRELSAVELSREVGSNFHASFGLGDLRLHPLFHDGLLCFVDGVRCGISDEWCMKRP